MRNENEIFFALNFLYQMERKKRKKSLPPPEWMTEKALLYNKDVRTQILNTFHAKMSSSEKKIICIFSSNLNVTFT